MLTDEKKRYYKVTRPDIGSMFCIFDNWNSIHSEFDGAEFGDSINVEMITLTKQEFETLEDFEGW